MAFGKTADAAGETHPSEVYFIKGLDFLSSKPEDVIW